MKHNKIHIAHGLFLLLLTVSILLSSAGLYAVSEAPAKEIAIKTKGKSSATGQGQKEEKVSASPTFEAVVVSLINHDFAKEIFFYSFEFSPVLEKVTLAPKRYIISEKYFRTLFTHFISPNAP